MSVGLGVLGNVWSPFYLHSKMTAIKSTSSLIDNSDLKAFKKVPVIKFVCNLLCDYVKFLECIFILSQ